MRDILKTLIKIIVLRNLRMKNYTRKYNKFISISMICLMITILMVVHINSHASKSNNFEYLKEVAQQKYTSDVVEYTDINIDSISLEAAIDEHCMDVENSTEDVCCNEVTGSISQVTADGSVQEIGSSVSGNTVVATESVGETGVVNNSGIVNDVNNQVADTKVESMPEVIEVENWQEIEGELSIKVNKQSSCVTIYKGETPIKAMICSAGESTPEGTFYMQSQWDWLTLIKGQYGRYCSQISGDYLFHSVPYNSMDIYDLDTEMYNDLGTLCSHGCIRLKCEDAKWIYDNCTTGTEITIYNDSNPGPLGKPGFTQIPEDQTWDPTDVDVE